MLWKQVQGNDPKRDHYEKKDPHYIPSREDTIQGNLKIREVARQLNPIIRLLLHAGENWSFLTNDRIPQKGIQVQIHVDYGNIPILHIVKKPSGARVVASITILMSQ